MAVENMVSKALEEAISKDGSDNGGTISPEQKKGVTSIMQTPMNHLAWVVNVLPSEEVEIPLEYRVEWPLSKAIDISQQAMFGGVGIVPTN
ncbi:unnamed protein product [Choristocarpus tenellus]